MSTNEQICFVYVIEASYGTAQTEVDRYLRVLLHLSVRTNKRLS